MQMIREPEDGNIEYKLQLLGKNTTRKQEMATQMRYRCNEGNGECIYVLGVTDLGVLVGLDDEDYKESMGCLESVAAINNYTMTMISKKHVEEDKHVYEFLVRENNTDRYIDIKVAVAGSVDAGKTSLTACLITGKKDDGRGSARLAVFNFRHEVESGRTSSVAQHIMGFDSSGKITNYSNLGKQTWSDIVKSSSKIVSFFDLCGHAKYLKTTISGLTSSFPDVCFIVVGANMGINKITKEHIFLCITLGIPFAFVITKIDICANRKNVLKETEKNIKRLLKYPGVRRVPYKITSTDDVITCTKNIYSESVVPIFHVSNVTGQGIDHLKHFLNILPSRIHDITDHKEIEYHIDTTFHVNGVGTVTGGQLLTGKIKVGDKLLLGPNNDKYETVQVRSIHCKRVPMQEVECGKYVCLGLRKIKRDQIRKGNVIISQHSQKIAQKEFDAEITVLKSHSTTIKPGYEPVLHTGSVRQTAVLTDIISKTNSRGKMKKEDNILRTGDKAVVRFKFKYRSEYIKPGDKIIFCEGQLKVVGIVK